MDSMLSKALRDFTSGPLNQLIVNLSGEQGYRWEEEFKRFLRKEPCWGERVLPQTFVLMVDYDLSFEAMVAQGNYSVAEKSEGYFYDLGYEQWHFPVPGLGKQRFEARYFHFNRSISTKDVRKGIAEEDPSNPWMPAAVEHVLAHGATFPEEQRKYRIVGLGAPWVEVPNRNTPCTPCLGGGGRRRMFWARHHWRLWKPDDRFLAVRPIKS